MGSLDDPGNCAACETWPALWLTSDLQDRTLCSTQQCSASADHDPSATAHLPSSLWPDDWLVRSTYSTIVSRLWGQVANRSECLSRTLPGHVQSPPLRT